MTDSGNDCDVDLDFICMFGSGTEAECVPDEEEDIE